MLGRECRCGQPPREMKVLNALFLVDFTGQNHCTHVTAFFIPGESNVFKGVLHRKRAQEACAWISLDSACLFPLGSDCVSFLHHCNRYFLKDFLVWTIFKVFIEFVTLLLFYVLVFWP